MSEVMKVRCVNQKNGHSRRFFLAYALSKKAAKSGWVIQDPNYKPVKMTKGCESPEGLSCKNFPPVETEAIEEIVGDAEPKEVVEVKEEVKPSPYDSFTKAQIVDELVKKNEALKADEKPLIKFSRAWKRDILLETLKG